MIDFRLLVKAGVHFGHQSSRWCPRMAPYIWGKKNGVHLIDVSKTAHQLEKAAKFLESVAAEGQTILWVGTKKPAQAGIKQAAGVCGMPSVTHRWIGGTLTNNIQVKKSITKYLHLGDVLKKADTTHYTKKELNSYQKRLDRLGKNVGGIVKMKWPVGALVVVDVKKEQSVVREAAVMGIPVIALVDTNSDPSKVAYVIPGNDDAPRSINVIIEYLSEAVQRGKELADKVAKEAKDAEKIALGEKKKVAPKKVVTSRVEVPKKAEAKKTEASKKEAAPKVEKAAEKKVEAKKEAAPKAEATQKADTDKK